MKKLKKALREIIDHKIEKYLTSETKSLRKIIVLLSLIFCFNVVAVQDD